QIRALLEARSKLTVSDMLAIQKDVYSAYDDFLAKEVVAAVRKKGTKSDLVRSAVPVLTKWNGQMEKDEAAPMITELLSNTLRAALTTLTLQGSGKMREHPNILPRPEVAETLLRARPAGWVSKDDWDTWLLQ